jgi:exonuclease VII large subunit
MRRGGIAIVGGCLVALALVAAPALATTDGPDYDAQVNPVCKSSNAEVEQLFTSFQQTFKALDRRANKLHGKKRRRVEQQQERLYEQIPFQFLALESAELAQLKAIAPPPGDESLVRDWLASRELKLSLYQQSIPIEQRIEKVYEKNIGASSLEKFERKLKRQQRQVKRLERQLDSLYDQYEAASKVDLELGTQLGATYCVTQATGAAVVVIGSSSGSVK